MADPLLGRQQYVADWDADTDQLELTGTLPGPAGVHEMTLAGITIALDAADLSVVNSIRLDDATAARGDQQRVDLLGRLVGHDVARQALDVVGVVALVRTRLGTPMSGRRQLGRVDGDMARLVTAIATAETAGLTSDERALADLEAMTIADRLDLRTAVPDFAVRLHEAATRLVGSSSFGSDDDWAPQNGGYVDVGDVAADICERAAPLIDDELLAMRLRRLVERWQTRLVTSAMLSEAAAAMPMPAQAASAAPSPVRLATSTPDSLPGMIAEQVPTLRRTVHDEYEVRLPGWSDRAVGWWVRVYRGASTVPLAVVPMRSDGAHALARFLAAERDAASLVVQIVADPTEQRAPHQIASFRAAIATGKRAARLERLRRPTEAVAAWHRSSELHAQAGDAWRAKSASARATGPELSRRGGRSTTIDPVVADLLGAGA